MPITSEVIPAEHLETQPPGSSTAQTIGIGATTGNTSWGHLGTQLSRTPSARREGLFERRQTSRAGDHVALW